MHDRWCRAWQLQWLRGNHSTVADLDIHMITHAFLWKSISTLKAKHTILSIYYLLALRWHLKIQWELCVSLASQNQFCHNWAWLREVSINISRLLEPWPASWGFSRMENKWASTRVHQPISLHAVEYEMNRTWRTFMHAAKTTAPNSLMVVYMQNLCLDLASPKAISSRHRKNDAPWDLCFKKPGDERSEICRLIEICLVIH